MTLTRTRRILLPLTALLSAWLLAACGSSSSSSSSSASTASASASACAKASLSLHSPGVLTVATDSPAYPPYFENNKPANGKGFESAVAYAVAKQLGFSAEPGQVDRRAVRQLIRAGPEVVRLRHQRDLDHAPAREGRRLLDAVLHEPAGDHRRDGVAHAHATSLAAFAVAKFGVQIGTTSLAAVNAEIKPTAQPHVFNTSNDVVTRSRPPRRRDRRRPRDRLLPHVRQFPHAPIVGQFSAPGGDNWGLLLTKGSPLTPCVDAAVTRCARTARSRRSRSAGCLGAGVPVL